MPPRKPPQPSLRPRSSPNAKAARNQQIVVAPPTVGGINKSGPATGNAAHRGRAAGRAAIKRNSTHLHIPVLGHITLPPPENLAWYAGIVGLAALEILEWPIAVVLGLGRVLSDNRHNKVLKDLGEALEEAG